MKEVPSDHDFFDPDYVKRWSESVRRYRPERKQLFKAFVAEITRAGKQNLSVLELGCGPGFLAEEILANCSVAKYYLFDYSPHMLKLSRSRLARLNAEKVFIEGNFKQRNWADSLPADFDVVVALQSVHELRHASRIPRLYRRVHKLLGAGGVFLVCDHVNSRLSSHDRAAHFLTVAEHLAALRQAGFSTAQEISAASDLSLLRAEKA